MPRPAQNWSHPAVAAFLKHVRSQCKTHGVKLSLRKTNQIKADGDLCTGCFIGDDAGAELIVAINAPDALPVLVHEFSHLCQWRDQTPAWVADAKNGDEMVQWLNGVDIPRIGSYIDKTREMELECEKGAVRLIEEFRLPIDIPDYIQSGNAYIFLYQYLKKSRRWPKPDNFPSRNKRILAACKDTFTMNYSRMPKKLETLFREEGI